jgi:hypothetical protein
MSIFTKNTQILVTVTFIGITSFLSSLAAAQLSLDSPPVSMPSPSMDLPDLALEKEFDGIDLAKYAKFWEKWHLVTTRYRKDNTEQRFVYANDLAYNALKKGLKVYPDGAMFGKVAFMTKEDSAFPNSLEPVAFTRVQLMRKDSKKYKDSNGWGYGIFIQNSGGVPYATEKSAVIACHACHQLVPQRDYVFSKPSFMGAFKNSGESTFRDKFLAKPLSELSSTEQNALRQTRIELLPNTRVKAYSMALFTGSISESIQPMIDYARKDKMPFSLYDVSSAFFIVAVPGPGSSVCKDEVRLVRIISDSNGKAMTHRPLSGVACGNEVRWGMQHRPTK